MTMHEGDPNQPIAPDDKLKIVMTGEGGDTPVTMTARPDGKMDLSFTATATGAHTLKMVYDGKVLQTQNIVVKDLHVDMDGDGLQCGSVGVPSDFNITLREEKGGKIVPPEGRMKVIVDGPGGPVDANLTINPDGSTRVEYTPKEAGEHTVRVVYREKEISARKVPVYDLDFKGLNGNGEGNEAVVDVNTSFGLGVKDGSGKYVVPPGLSVVLEGPSGEVPCNMSKNADGSSQCDFTPIAAGAHILKVKCGDVLLREVPVQVNDLHVDADGAGLQCGAVNVPSDFTVTLRDRAGGNIVSPEGRMKVIMDGPDGPVETALTSNPDGSTKVEYTPKTAGIHKMRIVYREKELYGKDVPVYDFDFNGLSGDGDGNDAVVDVLKEFNMGVKDGSGAYAIPDGLTVTLEGPSGEIACDMSKSGDGSARCGFTPLASGAHTLKVRCGDVLLREVPVNVRDLHVDATGPGLQCGAVGVETDFLLTLRESEGGKVVPPGNNLSVVVEGPDGHLDATLSVQEDGSTKVLYTPRVAGEHTVRIIYREKELLARPVPVYDFDFDGLNGDGEGNVAVVDVLKTFNMGVKDGSGGYKLPEGLSVVLEGPSGSVPCTLGDGSNGSNKCSFTATVAGGHSLRVLCNDVLLREIPVLVNELHVETAGDGLQCAAVGAPTSFIVVFKEKPDGRIISPPAENFVLNIVSAKGQAIQANITQMDDGSFTCSYTPLEAGEHTVTVLYRGVERKLHKVPVYDFNLDGIDADGQGNIAVVDIMSSFGMGIFDGDSYVLPEGLEVKLAGPSGAIVADLNKEQDGKLKCSYTPTAVGPHSLQIISSGVILKEIGVEVRNLHLEWEGDGLIAGMVGVESAFRVTFFDKPGGKVYPLGANMEIKINCGNSSPPVTVTQNADDSYGAVFLPTVCGEHKIDLLYRQNLLKTASVSIVDLKLDFSDLEK